MNNYLKQLDEETKKYFKILSSDFPEWLIEYIETPEMQRLSKISQACGTDYTKLYKHEKFYNILDHSVGCTLIVWNFTKDKKQTLSALFHDIATPTFKHCIDFLNGDYETQESTEDLTTDIIKNSKEIMSLLKRLFYQNLEVQKNENGIDEIGFRKKEIANKFVDMASVLWPNWCDNRYKITAQFLADTVKKMGEQLWLLQLYLQKSMTFH